MNNDVILLKAKEIITDLGKVATWIGDMFESLQGTGILCSVDPDDLDTELLDKMQYLPPSDSGIPCEGIVSCNLLVGFENILKKYRSEKGRERKN